MAVSIQRARRFTPETWRNLRVALVFLSPWLVGMLGLWLIPTGLSLYFSFTDYTGAVWPPHWIGLDNFRAMFDGTDPDFSTTLGVTAWWVFLSVPIGLAASLGLAMLLNMRVRGISLLPHDLLSALTGPFRRAARCCSSGCSIPSTGWSIKSSACCICRSSAGSPTPPGPSRACCCRASGRQVPRLSFSWPACRVCRKSW